MDAFEHGQQLLSRFRSRADFTDLLTAVDVFVEAAKAEANPTNKASFLLALGRALTLRYELGHQIQDIEGAASALAYAQSLMSPDSEVRADIAESLSHVYATAVAEGGEGRIRLGGIGPARNQMRSNALAALNATSINAPSVVSRLYTLAHADVVAFVEDVTYVGLDFREVLDGLLERALGLLDQAMNSYPGDELSSLIQYDIARCLAGKALISNSASSTEIGACYERSLEAASQADNKLLILRSAQGLGRWHADVRNWDRSAAAYRIALATASRVLENQSSPLDREPWLGQMPRLGSYAAFALVKTSATPEAIRALELLRGHWGFQDSIPAVTQEAVSGMLREAESGLTYLICTPWGSVAISVLPTPAPEPNLMTSFDDHLTESVVDAILGTGSGALRVGARPGERTPWQILADFINETQPEVGAPPSMVARDAVLRSLHASFGVQPGAYLRGYLGVVSHEKGSEESDEAALRRYETTVDACCEVVEPLMTPVANSLRAVGLRRLLLVPDGKFAMLPLHASRIVRDLDSTYFCDEFDCRLTNSAKAEVLLSRILPNRESQQQSVHITVVANTQSDNQDRALPWSEYEMSSILDTFPSEARNGISGNRATGERVLRSLAQSNVAHFACHGAFDPDYPWHSGLELANGRLTAEDILVNRVFKDYKLVVFSSCQTAVTDFKRMPEEMLGLPLAALFSGARTCVGALWPVQDLSASVFFRELYRRQLIGTKDTPEDLRSARNSLRATTVQDLRDLSFASPRLSTTFDQDPNSKLADDARPFAKPYYWAPFVHYGLGV